MTDDSCKPSRSAGSVPRACTPFSPPPPTSSVPVVAPPVFVPVAPVIPVMTVSGEAPDRFGNVDIRPFVRAVLDQALLDLDLFAPFLSRIVESGTFAPASHVSDGSIHHTAVEIGQIAAGEVAKVVAGAPAALDTLKEIADVIGTDSGQEAGGILKRVADLETGKASKGEMSITPVAGSADRKTIQLKDGTSATVLTDHQDISGKVDKVQDKGLSSNDYTDADKAKLDGLSPQVQADYGQTNTTAPDFIKNKPTLAAVATSGSYDDLSGKPTIPAPVAVDATLATQGAAADAKAVGDALRSGFTEWVVAPSTYGGESLRLAWSSAHSRWKLYLGGRIVGEKVVGHDVTSITFDYPENTDIDVAVTATRHLVTPTKTSQLTNDGDGTNAFVKTNDARLSDARTPTAHAHAVSDVTGLGAALAGKLDAVAMYPEWNEQQTYPAGFVVTYSGMTYRAEVQSVGVVPANDQDKWQNVQVGSLIAGKADKVANATNGNLAALDAHGNLADSGVKSSDFAAKADLPYALVTPGEWEFSGGSYGQGYYIIISSDGQGGYNYDLYLAEDDAFITEENKPTDGVLSVFFEAADMTATRPSLPGHLLDRANNLIDATTGNVTLTLPAYQEGKVRDLLVHVNLGDDGTNPYTVTVNFPTGETNTGFKVKGNASAPIPAPNAAGEWLFSFSECAPHKMAVSLAQLQDATVAGGS